MAAAILITGRTKPGKRDELYALYREHVVPHVAASDAIATVVWSADRDDEDTYHLFEVFSEGSDVRDLTEAEWFKTYMALAAPLAAAPPETRRLDPRWTKGV